MQRTARLPPSARAEEAAVLELLLARGRPMREGEIAIRLGMTVGHVFRCVATLRYRGEVRAFIPPGLTQIHFVASPNIGWRAAGHTAPRNPFT